MNLLNYVKQWFIEQGWTVSTILNRRVWRADLLLVSPQNLAPGALLVAVVWDVDGRGDRRRYQILTSEGARMWVAAGNLFELHRASETSGIADRPRFRVERFTVKDFETYREGGV